MHPIMNIETISAVNECMGVFDDLAEHAVWRRYATVDEYNIL